MRFNKRRAGSIKASFPSFLWSPAITRANDDYVNGFLFFWHPRENEIKIGSNSQCGLTIDIDGSENNVQYYETQIMAIVCEVYYRMGGANISYETLLNNYKNVQVKK